MSAYAADAFCGGQDDSDSRVVVEEHLAVASAWTDRATAHVSHGNDRREFLSARGTGMPEGHQLDTRPTGEMEEIDTAIHPAVHTAHRGPMV
jgi:hypothetical protein